MDQEDAIGASIAERLERVRAQLASACRAAGRGKDEVQLLAVSKTRPPEDVISAFQAGQSAFGENQLQDALPKVEHMRGHQVEWHFIGPIQSNKTRPIAADFDWVHSIDRVKIAERLSNQRAEDLPHLQVCLQFNVSGEASKSGFEHGELHAAAEAVSALPRVKLRGLMAIPAPASELASQRAAFAEVREAYDALNSAGFELDTLSMGMTNDLEAAVLEGATIVRIGTAVFGPRAPR